MLMPMEILTLGRWINFALFFLSIFY